MFALAAVQYGGVATRVLAVEPSQAAERLIKSNVRLAGAEAQVEVLVAAAGDRDGVLGMLTTGPGGEDFVVAADAPRRDSVPTPMLSLALLGGRVPGVTHLKIDIEGFEAEVLSGGWEYLRASRPVLFLELHGDILRQRGKDPAALLAGLDQCGYRRLECHSQSIDAATAAGLSVARLVRLPEGLS